MITLVEELDRRKELEAIGDVAYVSGLLDGVPDRPSIEHYVKIVRDKALLRGLIHAANAAIARASDQSDPAEEVLNEAEAAIFQLSEKRIGRGFLGITEIVKESFGSVDALLQRGQRVTGLETHYTDLDEMTSGLQKSDLVIIAARPSMGKTAFAMNIAENAAVNGRQSSRRFFVGNVARSSAAAFALLPSPSGLAQNAHRLSVERGHEAKVVHAMEQLAHAPIFIDDTPGISLSEMRAKARRLQQSQGRIDLIVVDYLQLMSGGSKRYENRTQEVSAISRGLKALAKEMNVPVVALSQLSRAPESRGGGSSPPTRRPARIGIHRAGRRRCGLHFPRRGLQPGRPRTTGQSRNHHRQTAQRPDRAGADGIHQKLHTIRDPWPRWNGIRVMQGGEACGRMISSISRACGKPLRWK